MIHGVDSRLVGVTASNTTKSIFTTRGNATAPWVRNASLWANDLDFSGASPWNSNGGYKKAGTLISPRHIVFAEHYQIANGSTVIFVDNDNNVVSRTLVDQKRIRSLDMQIGVLDADVPPSIAFYPILSSVYTDGFINERIPVIALDQEDHATVHTAFFRPTNGGSIPYSLPTEPLRTPFYEQIISGDSGNPVFLVINDQLVIATTHWLAGSGWDFGAQISYLNAAMDQFGAGHQVTELDVSCFNT